MTAAVCLKCGAFKFGAFTPCSDCGFKPESDEDMAKGILLSDHNMNRPALEEISAQIASGISPSFDAAALAEMAQEISEMGPPPKFWGCLVAKWLLIGIMFALAANLAFMIWKAKSGH